MKVIDLYVKIAKNKKEAPPRIKCDDIEYRYSDYYEDYYNEKYGRYLHHNAHLNDEIEIIEDAPKDAIITLNGTPNGIRKTLDLPQYKDWWQREQENKAPKEDKKIEKLVINKIEDREHYNIKEKINEIIERINGE